MDINSNYAYATHQPLIRAAIECYAPKFALELGTGDYSTPVFTEYDLQLLSIENDGEWIEYVKSKYGLADILYRNLGDIKIGTELGEFTDIQKAEIINFYDTLEIPELKPNLLFVDQFTSCRALSVNSLKEKFDLIIYHDCESAGFAHFSYDHIKDDGFNKYFLKSPLSWTCLMISKDKDKGYEELSNKIQPYISEFKMEYSLGYMELTNKY